MKAKTVRITIDEGAFAQAAEGAVNAACMRALEKGATPEQLGLVELQLRAAAGAIGHRLFGGEPVDYSDGRLAALAARLTVKEGAQ